MATTTNYNDFGASMIENRPTMDVLDMDNMTRNERKLYRAIIDEVASTAYDYMADPAVDGFPAFRNAIHKLYAFVGTDTRILAIEGYSVRFIPAVVPYKVVKSQQFKTAEKNIRLFKKCMEWACEVSKVNPEAPDAVLFGGITDTKDMGKFFSAEYQDEYNAVLPVCRKAMESGKKLTVSDLNANLKTLEKTRDDLAAQKWHYYKDWKNPMQSTSGKKLAHAPESIRKNIEDTMADILTARTLMTTAQLDKEHKQIKGGRK